MPLQDAISGVGKIEARYRASIVDRIDAAKLLGYSGSTGPSNMALAALSAYGLIERVGKGEVRVTELARAILHPAHEAERKESISRAALNPSLYRELRERFATTAIPPEDGVVTYLNRSGFNPTAVRPAANAFLRTMAYLQEIDVTESSRQPSQPAENGREDKVEQAPPRSPDDRPRSTSTADGRLPSQSTPHESHLRGGGKLMDGERIVFVEEGSPEQYLKVIASGELDEILLEALEDYIKRQKKRLAQPRESGIN